MDNTGSIFYDPYRPQPFGDGMGGMIAYNAANMLGSPFGMSFQAPTGYSNSATLWSKIQTDRYHQQAMAMAGEMTKARIGNVMTSLMAPAMSGLPGLQFTQQQRMAVQNFAATVSPVAYGMLAQSQQGRYAIDAMAGGYNVYNTMDSHIATHKMMMDPVARGGHLSWQGIQQQSKTFFNEMFEGTPAERRARTSGFLPGEVHNMQVYLARQGRLGGIGDMQAAMTNPTFARAMENGSFTDRNLLDLGMGNAKALQGQDYNDPKVQELIYKVNASKQRGEAEQLTQVSAAIKDVLIESKIPGEIGNILSYLGQFTEKYSTQLGGAQTASILRKSHAALKDFGYGAQEIMMLHGEASKVADSYGYEGAFGAQLGVNQNIFMGTLLKNQRFAGASYGRGNAFQHAQMRSRIEAGFGRSTEGSILGAISLLSRTNTIDDSTPEGKRLQAILRDIDGSNYIGDQEFVSMSPEQKVELVAKGLGVSANRVYQTMGNQFPIEAEISKKNITRLAGQFAMQDLSGDVKAAAIRGMVSEFDDLGLDQARAFTDLLGDAAVQNLRENPLLADDETSDMTSGGMMLGNIRRKAAAGDANAKALLARAGQTSAEQMQYFERIASYSNQSIKGQFRSMENISLQLGKRTEAELGQNRVAVGMEAFKKNLFSQTSLGNMAELLTAQLGEFEKAGAAMGEGGDPRKLLVEAINNAVGGQLSAENQGAIEENLKTLTRLRDQKLAIAKNLATDNNSEAAVAAATQYAAELDKVIKSVNENAGIRLADKDEAMGITKDANGNDVAVAVPGNVAQAITANFGGVTINLGEDAIVQIKDAIIRTERGNTNTVGNQ